jgi:hypothetical protein
MKNRSKNKIQQNMLPDKQTITESMLGIITSDYTPDESLIKFCDCLLVNEDLPYHIYSKIIFAGKEFQSSVFS